MSNHLYPTFPFSNNNLKKRMTFLLTFTEKKIKSFLGDIFMPIQFRFFILLFLILSVGFNCKSSDTQDTSNSIEVTGEDGSKDRSVGEMGSKDPDEESARSLAKSAGKKGCIKGDCTNGFGVYVYENGDIYTGNFKEDKREGDGSFLYENKEVFKGLYSQDSRNGKGIYKFKNGDSYSGNFKNGEIEGDGVYTFKDGKVLNGKFSNNGSSGEGTVLDDGRLRNCKIKNRKLSCE